uniref:Uncharacterized protein n=1 Tax=Anopheles coluzzii TaxID=1518534 RepID=A0A8W7P8X1_ANOCL
MINRSGGHKKIVEGRQGMARRQVMVGVRIACPGVVRKRWPIPDTPPSRIQVDRLQAVRPAASDRTSVSVAAARPTCSGDRGNRRSHSVGLSSCPEGQCTFPSHHSSAGMQACSSWQRCGQSCAGKISIHENLYSISSSGGRRGLLNSMMRLLEISIALNSYARSQPSENATTSGPEGQRSREFFGLFVE